MSVCPSLVTVPPCRRVISFIYHCLNSLMLNIVFAGTLSIASIPLKSCHSRPNFDFATTPVCFRKSWASTEALLHDAFSHLFNGSPSRRATDSPVVSRSNGLANLGLDGLSRHSGTVEFIGGAAPQETPAESFDD
jgi:hypothetical protein